jgi:hypothetical protein
VGINNTRTKAVDLTEALLDGYRGRIAVMRKTLAYHPERIDRRWGRASSLSSSSSPSSSSSSSSSSPTP